MLLTLALFAIRVSGDSASSEGSILEKVVDHTTTSLAGGTKYCDDLLGHFSEAWLIL